MSPHQSRRQRHGEEKKKKIPSDAHSRGGDPWKVKLPRGWGSRLKRGERSSSERRRDAVEEDVHSGMPGRQMSGQTWAAAVSITPQERVSAGSQAWTSRPLFWRIPVVPWCHQTRVFTADLSCQAWIASDLTKISTASERKRPVLKEAVGEDLQRGCEEMLLLLKCCFTSTETVGLSGTGAQDGHLDFHTAPELWRNVVCGWWINVVCGWWIHTKRLWRKVVRGRWR